MEEPTDTSLNESVDDGHSFLDMELEALQSIYINELEVDVDEKCTTVSIDLFPATADKLEEQYVRLTLQFILKEEYPEVIPEIKIRNPRGLSDEKLTCIIKDLLTIAEAKRGNSMLFEMIDAAKEHLTVGNRPSGECAICLYGFSDNDVFTKTECYHYFHSHCLARYAKNFIENSKDVESDAKSKCISNELLCPMCRIPIQFNETYVDYLPPEESDDNNFILTEEMVELQKKMANLYQKQVEKGGIIDVEAEKNKYLLEISNVPTRVCSEEKHEQKLVADVDSCTTDSQVEPSDELDSPVSERKERVRDRQERFDYRGRNRNFNRVSENKGNYRSDHRYNRHSYDNYQRNYNKNRYSRHNSAGSRRQFEDSELSHNTTDSTEPCDHGESEEPANKQDAHDDLSETSEQASIDSKSKFYSKFSPRYNRGPRRGGNHYGYHSNNRRFNKPGYRERNSSQPSRRYTASQGDEQLPANSEEIVEKDVRTNDDGDCNAKTYDDSDRNVRTYGDRNARTYGDRNARTYDDRNARTYNDGDRNVRAYDDEDRNVRTYDRKANYRYNNFKRDEDYKQRHPDSKNSQRGYKGAYGRKDNYSYNNYSRSNRYGDYRDRDHYHADRERNFRGRRTYREGKYQDNDDNPNDSYNRQGVRNYTRNRPDRHADRSYTESSNNESESFEFSSHSSDHKKLSVEKENCSKTYPDSSEQQNKSSQKMDSTLAENCPGKLTESGPILEGSKPKVFPSISNEILQVSSRTVNPPPGFANPLKKVIYGLQGANPPPGFNKS